MKQFLPFALCLIFLVTIAEVKGQVWFPEGGYNYVQPSVFSLDNQQIYTIGKASEDSTKSYWVAAKYDGKSWIKLPLLALNKTAEILKIKAYAGNLYIAGNFTFDNGVYSGIIRFKDVAWQPIVKLGRPNQLPSIVSALEVYDGKLIFGGNFNMVGTDSLPYLAAFNGIGFSNILTKTTNCKRCFPNYIVTDIAANDSILGVSGYFNQVAEKTSKSLFIIRNTGKLDTFASTPNNMLFDKITVVGSATIIGAGMNPADKRLAIFKAENGIFTNLKLNLDTIAQISKMLIFDNALWLNGITRISGKTAKATTLQLVNSVWTDFSSNYPGARSIDAGRGSLWAIGNADRPLSIWNTNRFVMRLYRNFALVRVKVFHDSDNNCVQDKNEKNLSKQLIKLPLSTVNKYSVTNDFGHAEFLFPIPALNTTKVPFVIILPRNFKPSNCSYDTIFRTFTSGVKALDSIQFPITRKANINDIKVIISAPKGTQVMKNKRMEYVILVENVGSNIVSGTLTLKKNTWLESQLTLGKLDTNRVDWSYANLNPGEKRYFTYSGVASDARFVDNTVLDAQASATIASVKNDYSNDDADSIQQIIDNSVNPFRKDIYPVPKPGDSISYLTMNNREIRYSISFNNFGTDTVYNAVITDTLDLNLDMSYIQETGSDKPFYTEIQTDPNNSYRGIIIWHFPNIKLSPNPTKNFELPNTGSYIGFKVVMKPVSNGNIVKNTAAVFYDNYYEGKTNTAYCTIVNTGIDKINAHGLAFRLYPNPAQHLLQLDLALKSGDNIQIINQMGTEVRSLKLDNDADKYIMDISGLSNGLYVVRVVKNGQMLYSKFVKM